MYHTNTKEVNVLKRLGRESDQLRFVQKMIFLHINKCYMHKLESIIQSKTHINLLEIEMQIVYPIPTRRLH